LASLHPIHHERFDVQFLQSCSALWSLLLDPVASDLGHRVVIVDVVIILRLGVGGVEGYFLGIGQ